MNTRLIVKWNISYHRTRLQFLQIILVLLRFLAWSLFAGLLDGTIIIFQPLPTSKPYHEFHWVTTQFIIIPLKKFKNKRLNLSVKLSNKIPCSERFPPLSTKQNWIDCSNSPRHSLLGQFRSPKNYQVIPGNDKICLLPIRKLPEVSSNGRVSWCFMALGGT